MNAAEKVMTACLQSPYKDDRHDWELPMYESYGHLNPRAWVYELRRCKNCRLMVLLHAPAGGGSHFDAPRTNDVIIHAFYEVKR